LEGRGGCGIFNANFRAASNGGDGGPDEAEAIANSGTAVVSEVQALGFAPGPASLGGNRDQRRDCRKRWGRARGRAPNSGTLRRECGPGKGKRGASGMGNRRKSEAAAARRGAAG